MQQHLLLLFKSKYSEIFRVQNPVGDFYEPLWAAVQAVRLILRVLSKISCHVRLKNNNRLLIMWNEDKTKPKRSDADLIRWVRVDWRRERSGLDTHECLTTLGNIIPGILTRAAELWYIDWLWSAKGLETEACWDCPQVAGKVYISWLHMTETGQLPTKCMLVLEQHQNLHRKHASMLLSLKQCYWSCNWPHDHLRKGLSWCQLGSSIMINCH